jgi:hypothetical protein
LRPFTFTRTETGVFAYFQVMPGTYFLAASEYDADPVPDEQPMTFDELRDAVERILGVSVPMTAPDQPQALLRRVSGVNTRMAAKYRDGRVLLLGDAAHVHSATGGPGLNLGLQDTLNLGWKLAALINGWAPEDLLDTYQSERYPVGKRVILSTMSQAVLNGPGPQITALRALFTELLEDEHNIQHIADLMSGADVHYDMGGAADHPLLGRWMPDLPLLGVDGPTRVAELLRPAKAVLLDLGASEGLAELAAGWQDRVSLVEAKCSASTGAPAQVLLIRPDGYVAWVATDEVHSGLTAALERWFGPAEA